MIEIKNLSHYYGDIQALNNVNLSIPRLKVGILGGNGCGKSTLFRHINGIKTPSIGSVRIDGEEITKKNIKNIRKKIGFVFDQPDNQLFSSSVFDDIAFGLRNLKIKEDVIKKLVNKILIDVNLVGLENRPTYNLSLGQKKKVALASILVLDTDYIILDEPFSGLDPRGLDDLLLILDRIYELGKTIIVSSHDVDLMYEWAEHIIIMKEGQISYSGEKEILLDKDFMLKTDLRCPRGHSDKILKRGDCNEKI